MIRNIQELSELSTEEKAKAFDRMLDHLYQCPIGCYAGKVIQHRSTTEKDVVDWIEKTQDVLEGKE